MVTQGISHVSLFTAHTQILLHRSYKTKGTKENPEGPPYHPLQSQEQHRDLVCGGGSHVGRWSLRRPGSGQRGGMGHGEGSISTPVNSGVRTRRDLGGHLVQALHFVKERTEARK